MILLPDIHFFPHMICTREALGANRCRNQFQNLQACSGFVWTELKCICETSIYMVFFTVEWAFNIYFIPKSSIFSLLSYNNSEIRFSLVLFFCYYIYFKCFWKEEFIKVCLFFKETSCFADAFFFIACFCFVNWLSSMVSRTSVNTKLAVHLYFCFRIICSEIWMQAMQNFFWTWWIQRKSHLHSYWKPWQKYPRFCNPGKSWLLLYIYC